MSAARIRRLTLSNFRSYRAATDTIDAQLVVLEGPNGAGKTNVIEALSFLAPGRGLRRATLDEIAFGEGDGSWAVAAELEVEYDSDPIDIGFNSRYLLDIAAQIEGEVAVLKLADPGSPTLIQDKDSGSALYVLMPMRV